MTEPKSIVFICTGNTCRSPMAQALFNHLNDKSDWMATSCGLAALGGELVSGNAIQVMRVDFGIDISDHRARPVTEDCIQKASLVLTMTTAQRDFLRQSMPAAAGRIMTIGECAGQPDVSIPDPFGRDLAAYRETAAALAGLIKKIIDDLPEISDTGERQNL